jgi:leucyl-tRNA synthetase
MILGEAELTGYRNEAGGWISVRTVKETPGPDGETLKVDSATSQVLEPVRLKSEEVTKKADEFVLKSDPGVAVESRAYKMSKSRGNVVNPDTVVVQYGADALRMYEMFMGPLEATKPWSMTGVEGISRFLARVWRMIADERADEIRLNPAVQEALPNEAQLRLLHRTIKAVTEDFEKLSFNTAISRLMEFTNEIAQAEPRPRALMEPFVLLLSPLAPHLAEELWQLLGHPALTGLRAVALVRRRADCRIVRRDSRAG